MRIDPFETERLIHRPLRLDDLNGFAALYADPETTRHIGTGGTRSRDEAQKMLAWFIEQYHKNGVGLFATVEKASAKIVGRCGFSLWNEGSERELELEYLIARDQWDQGFGTEAAKGFLAQAAEHLSFVTPHVIALIQPGNSRAINVARNVGMTFWQERTLAGIVTQAYRKDLPQRR